MSSPKAKSIDEAEVAKFSAMAEEWWDEGGKFAPLHKFNPIRIAYLKDQIAQQFGTVEGISILDAGCGGGLLCEPFSRLGAKVTGIDASEKNIGIASIHAKNMELSIDYQAASVEALAESGQQFDVVFAMEVVEHVADVEAFLRACASLVKPGGLLFVATMNRTLKAYALAIVGAEYVLRWLPRGTHDWKKFLKPSEVEAVLRDMLKLKQLQGVSYHPFSDSWSLSSDVAVNYMMMFAAEQS